MASMSTKQSELNDIKVTTMDMFEDLETIFTEPQEATEIMLIKLTLTGFPSEMIMNHVIEKLLPHKKHVENKNIEFFKNETKSLFLSLPEDRLTHYTNVLTNELEEDTLDCIWAHVLGIIRIAENYKKRD